MSENAERIVLGMILQENANFAVASKLVASEDFSLAAHRRFFREIGAMLESGLGVDTGTLSERLGDREVKGLGGRAYTASLTEGVPRDYRNLGQYCAIVAEAAGRRRAHLALLDCQKVLETPGSDVEQAAQAFLKRIAPHRKQQKSAPSQAHLIRLSDVQAKRVPFLWEPYLPLGMLSMFSGDSDVGKSYLIQAVAAGLTLGQLPCGGGPCEPINVLHFTNENSAEFVLRPRFDLLGGDATRYFHCPGSEWIDEQGVKHAGGITFADVAILDEALARSQAKLLIIDPIQSYLPSKTDAYRANEIRQLLDPLAKLAEKHACCIVLIRHLSKGTGGKAIYRGSMSIDFTAAVRSELLVGYAPDDRVKRAVVHVVHNVGREGSTMGFEIDGAGEFRWTGESDLTASQILADPSNESPEMGRALKDATEWLRDFLTPDSQSQADCVKQAEKNGISFASLKRAKARLGVKSRKASFKAGFIWYLLSEEAQPPLILEPVEPLRSNQQKIVDLDRFKPLEPLRREESHLSHFAEQQDESSISFEDLQAGLSHFDEVAQENHEAAQEEYQPLNHFVKYNNNKDLSIYSLITNDEVAQPAQGSTRAREGDGKSNAKPLAPFRERQEALASSEGHPEDPPNGFDPLMWFGGRK